ncbi:hypothetical protein F5Y09DRAFT_350860 [Xylaria sp. FL1042]|nr:hypothetical protein F5Y09DRAFT_350860 [Xylaria sp. FL1042]
MKTLALLLLLSSLAGLGKPTALPETYLSNPSICMKSQGVYDVCDTEHSFIRCNGHEALLVTDCIIGNSTYCRIVDSRGRCDGASPPKLCGGSPPCETEPSPLPRAM